MSKPESEAYQPLILVFLFIAVVSVNFSIQSGHKDLMNWTNSFTEGFIISLSFFKIIDHRAFTDGYVMPDLLTNTK